MSANRLRRCTVCKRWGATFLVQELGGEKSYYCYNCWKARFGPSPDSPDKSEPAE